MNITYGVHCVQTAWGPTDMSTDHEHSVRCSLCAACLGSNWHVCRPWTVRTVFTVCRLLGVQLTCLQTMNIPYGVHCVQPAWGPTDMSVDHEQYVRCSLCADCLGSNWHVYRPWTVRTVFTVCRLLGVQLTCLQTMNIPYGVNCVQPAWGPTDMSTDHEQYVRC